MDAADIEDADLGVIGGQIGNGHAGATTPLFNNGEPLNTLDEPVSTTLMRDVRTVFNKFTHVLVPRNDKTLLRDWDLWGPLMLCVSLALILRDTASEDQKTLVFTSVFVIVWVGSAVVTINSQLLGGTLSFFQSLCALGYCILPLVVSALCSRILSLANVKSIWIHIFVVVACLAWSVFASIGFLAESQPPRRKPLAIYPLVLFYVVIAWMILIQPR
eukprot:CFRG4056T1